MDELLETVLAELAIGVESLPRGRKRERLEDWFESFGDIMQIALPVGAGVSTFVAGAPDGSMWDREGTKQFAYSFGASWGICLARRVCSMGAVANPFA